MLGLMEERFHVGRMRALGEEARVREGEGEQGGEGGEREGRAEVIEGEKERV